MQAVNGRFPTGVTQSCAFIFRLQPRLDQMANRNLVQSRYCNRRDLVLHFDITQIDQGLQIIRGDRAELQAPPWARRRHRIAQTRPDTVGKSPNCFTPLLSAEL